MEMAVTQSHISHLKSFGEGNLVHQVRRHVGCCLCRAQQGHLGLVPGVIALWWQLAVLCSLRAMSGVCSWETKSASCHTESESESCLGYWEDELLTWWVKLCCKVSLPSGVKDCGKTRLLWDGLAWPCLFFMGRREPWGKLGCS